MGTKVKSNTQLYHIPIDSLNNLIEARDKFNTAYNNWIRTVPKEQADYINNPSNININRLVNDMNYAGTEEPRDMLERQLQNSGIDTSNLDITQGTQSPAIVQRIQLEGRDAFNNETDANEYDSVSAIFTELQNKYLELNNKIKELPALSSPDDTNVRAYGLSINRLEERLTTDFNKIKSPAIQLTFRNEKDKYFQRFNEMRQSLSDKQMVENPLDDDEGLYGEPIQLINPKSAGVNLLPSPPSSPVGSLNPKGGLSPPPSRAGSAGSTGSQDPAGAFPPAEPAPAEPAPAEPAPAEPAPAEPAPAKPAPAPQQPPKKIGKVKAIGIIRNYVNTAKKGGQVGYSLNVRNSIFTIYGEEEYDRLATVFNTSGKTNRARNIQKAVIDLVRDKGLEDTKPPAPRSQYGVPRPPQPPQNMDLTLDTLAPDSGMSIVP